MCIITPSNVKSRKEKTITKSVSLITRKNDHHWVSTDSKNQIAIIYAQGEIQSGEGDVNTMGEGSMRRSLQEQEETKMLKLLYFVLTARKCSTSDLIWRTGTH
jgi:protease-4